MIYLSKLNTGFLLLTRQLFSGRVILLSAAVPAGRSLFSFSTYLQKQFFNWAFVPGWTINEFPAFANTQRYSQCYFQTNRTILPTK